ncbi:hypothetical protein RRG08_060141 [Elysia crispata]|uniref:Uncharacterized protein n=1 Tax=Elysia crispata TaxID=231223 RepID=A0AAE1DPL7_9GAST|nr:hypothetical protein RRG08_060141 [Elysia crispata]
MRNSLKLRSGRCSAPLNESDSPAPSWTRRDRRGISLALCPVRAVSALCSAPYSLKISRLLAPGEQFDTSELVNPDWTSRDNTMPLARLLRLTHQVLKTADWSDVSQLIERQARTCADNNTMRLTSLT